MRASSSDFSIFIRLFLLLSLEFEPCDPHIKLNKIYDDRNRLEEEDERATRLRNWTQSKVMCVYSGAHTHSENRPKHEALKSFLFFFFFFFFSFNFGFKHFCHSQQEKRLKWTATKLSYILFIKLFPFSLLFSLFLFLVTFYFSFSWLFGGPVIKWQRANVERRVERTDSILLFVYRSIVWLSIGCDLCCFYFGKIANHSMSRPWVDQMWERRKKQRRRRGNKPKILGQWWWSMVDWIQMKVISLNRQISFHTIPRHPPTHCAALSISLSISTFRPCGGGGSIWQINRCTHSNRKKALANQ